MHHHLLFDIEWTHLFQMYSCKSFSRVSYTNEIPFFTLPESSTVTSWFKLIQENTCSISILTKVTDLSLHWLNGQFEWNLRKNWWEWKIVDEKTWYNRRCGWFTGESGKWKEENYFHREMLIGHCRPWWVTQCSFSLGEQLHLLHVTSCFEKEEDWEEFVFILQYKFGWSHRKLHQ